MLTSQNIRSISESISGLLGRRVRPKRERHIRGVVATIDALAVRFSLDRERAQLIGVAHDMDRDLPPWRSYALISDWKIQLYPAERRNPRMHHGAITAERLRREYGVNESSVLTAVRYHTLGHMTLDALGLALFVADYCEPGRTFPDAVLREEILARETLEGMANRILEVNVKRFGPLEEPSTQLYARLQGA